MKYLSWNVRYDFKKKNNLCKILNQMGKISLLPNADFLKQMGPPLPSKVQKVQATGTVFIA